MQRPILNEVNLQEAMAGILERRGGLFATMDIGQWDSLLESIYDVGGCLLELDQNETPVRAYRKPPTTG